MCGESLRFADRGGRHATGVVHEACAVREPEQWLNILRRE